jgi:type VI secretion system protein ImpK
MTPETPLPFDTRRSSALPAPPPPAPIGHGDTFLLSAFREFYRELLKAKHRVERGEWPAEERYGDGDSLDPLDPLDLGADRAALGRRGAIWQELLTLLERQALDAARSGGDIGRELYLQAQYAMAALADEIFLHLDWPGRLAWKENLLEAKLFGTHRAGEVVLERIEAVLRGRDPVYAELARVYLMALALGFEGKLRGSEEGPALLAAYRRALYRFAFRRDPRVVRGEEPVAPEAYAATVETGPGARLPYLRRWVIGAAVVVVLWIAGGHLIWRHLVSDFEPHLERILTAERADGSGLVPLPRSGRPSGPEDGDAGGGPR